MRTFAVAATLAASFSGVQSVAATTAEEPRQRGGLYRRQYQHSYHQNQGQVDWWNYANETTKGATADGKYGVIIEPDIVVGYPGIDGGIQKVGKSFEVIIGVSLLK
jgi:hypothetical protein